MCDITIACKQKLIDDVGNGSGMNVAEMVNIFLYGYVAGDMLKSNHLLSVHNR